MTVTFGVSSVNLSDIDIHDSLKGRMLCVLNFKAPTSSLKLIEAVGRWHGLADEDKLLINGDLLVYFSNHFFSKRSLQHIYILPR